jgi:uncharacterized protein YjiS (DUF1127 family)
MVIGQVWINANPELRGHLRKANEARSATFYAAWRAVTAPVRGLIEALRRVRRERETYGALSRLNDRQLQDIGLSRSEIGSIAQAVAAEPPEAGLTIAELRQTRRIVPAGRDAQVVPLPRADERRSRGGSWVAPQSTAAASAQRDRAAS